MGLSLAVFITQNHGMIGRDNACVISTMPFCRLFNAL